MAKGKKVIDETVSAFKKLKEEVKGYKDELATLTAGSEEWRKTAEKLRNAQKQVDAINKAAKGTLTAYNREQVNSINELKELIKLKNQERNAMDMGSKEYREATEELKELNDKLREAGTSAGDWRANVGNYANSIRDAFSTLGTAATGLSGNMGGLNASMLKVASNPLGTTVLAITGAIKMLAEGIKSSETNTNRWNEALTPLKTVMVLIQREAQKVADAFLTFVESLKKSETAGNAIQKVLQVIITMFNQTVTRIKNIKDGIVGVYNDISGFVGKMKEMADGLKSTFQPVTDFVDGIANSLKTKLEPVIDWIVKQYNWLASTNVGKMFGLQTIEQVKKAWDDAGNSVERAGNEYTKTASKVLSLQKAEERYQKSKRALMEANSKLTGEIADLEEKIADARLNKDYDKALELLNQKREKEGKLVKNNVSLAQQELSIIRQRNALAGSNTKDLEAETAAQVALNNAKNEESRTNARLINEERQLQQAKTTEEKRKNAEALAKSVKELNAALKELETNYNNVVKTLETPLKPEGAEIDKSSIDGYYDALKTNNEAEYQAYVELTEAKISELERFIEVQKAANQDVTTQELELAALRKEQAGGYAVQYKKMLDANTKADKERAKTQKALQKSELQGYANLFDSVSGLFEENTVAYKATATAKALINTYLAATSALAETPGGYIAKAVAMASTLASGIAQVMSIWKTNPRGESSPSIASTPSVAEPSLAESNPYTYTRAVQTVDEADELNKPLWVSVSEINRVQERVRVTETEATY